MRLAVIDFPGTGGDDGLRDALEDVGGRVDYVWHASEQLGSYDAVFLPGGHSFGDYLRAGALAALSPIMTAVRKFADDGGLVVGLGNGFQVLCEAGLLPGAFLPNPSNRFHCDTVSIRVEQVETALTYRCHAGEMVQIPVAHKFGRFFVDEQTLDRLRRHGQIVFRYVDGSGQACDEVNPTGSTYAIAGVTNEQKNVLGMMGRPERNAGSLSGNGDGKKLFESLREYLSPSTKGGDLA